jgi:predicted nucleic acid-binding protein
MSDVAYLDTSAFMKLVLDEPQTPEFARALAGWPRLVASELVVVEVTRAAQRQPQPRDAFRLATEHLRAVALRPLSRAVMRRAATLQPAALRTLDALHLATALDLPLRPAAFFTYDRRLAAAARQAGLAVLSPGA